MSIESESLMARIGIFGPVILHDSREKSSDIPSKITDKIMRMFRSGDTGSWKPPSLIDPRDILKRISNEVIEIEGKEFTDEIVYLDLLSDIRNARSVLMEWWPKDHLEGTLLGSTPVMSFDDVVSSSEILAMVNNPSSIIDDMSSGALTVTQAELMRKIYPEISAGIDDVIITMIIDMNDNRKTIRPTLEWTLKLWLGMDTAVPLAEIELQSQMDQQQKSAQPPRKKRAEPMDYKTESEKAGF